MASFSQSGVQTATPVVYETSTPECPAGDPDELHFGGPTMVSPMVTDRAAVSSNLSFGDLPNEIIDHILSFLDSIPPSTEKIHEWPNANIGRREHAVLKQLSLTSQFLRTLVINRLFAHCLIELSQLQPYLRFVDHNSLSHHVTSLVVLRKSNWSDTLHPVWWDRLLGKVNPETLTIIAPPFHFAELACCSIVDCDNWAFAMPLQIIQLKQPRQLLSTDSQEVRNENLFDARPWTGLLVNEGSSLKAYSTYHYWQKRTPSLIGTFATKRSALPEEAISRLTSFQFTAIFPFYNHVDDVLKVVRNSMLLETFGVKLAPDQHSNVIHVEQSDAHIDLTDAWMEMESAYELIAHTVVSLGRSSSLARFQSHDSGVVGLWDSLKKKLNDHFDPLFVYSGNGLWIRDSCTRNKEGGPEA